MGASHGGANESVIQMLSMIGNENNINHYIKKAKNKDDSFRLMGLGTGCIKIMIPELMS